MEGSSNSNQFPDIVPGQMDMNMNWRPPVYNQVKSDESVQRRLEWIAVVLFIVNFFLMIYTLSLYYRDEGWAIAIAVVNTGTALMMLLTILFSIFGKTNLSRIVISIGLIGFMISIVSFGARLIQMISESHW